jgi:hypothetical protein
MGENRITGELDHAKMRGHVRALLEDVHEPTDWEGLRSVPVEDWSGHLLGCCPAARS